MDGDRAGILETMDDYWVAVIWALLPTVVVSAIFVYVIRSILRMDRTERKAYSKVEAEERLKRGMPPVQDDPDAGLAVVSRDASVS